LKDGDIFLASSVQKGEDGNAADDSPSCLDLLIPFGEEHRSVSDLVGCIHGGVIEIYRLFK